MSEPAIKKAITVLDMLSRDSQAVRLAELRMKKILDEKSLIEGAREEAREQELKEGFKKYREKFISYGNGERNSGKSY